MAWIIANTAIKTSIIDFYLTLFSVNRRFRLIAWVWIGIVLAFGVGVVLQTFLLCRPLAKTWNPALPGRCGSLVGAVIGTSAVNVMVDIGIILLPMPMVWNLQMARSRKIALTITFGLGMMLAIFTDLEPLLGIIVACAPLFPPTFKAIHYRTSKWSLISSSARGFARLATKGTNGTKGSQNQASDDTHPLANLRGGSNKTQVTSPISGLNSFNAVASDEDARQHRTITVTKGWDIRTDTSKFDIKESV
ncbi:MAG: hypothetical protein Q9192_003123 [Flavoplaca navasiana]